ncbi:MAG: aldehyde dehydrogenase family protein [Alphaproteobacteria bacterium]|nr:aldehyde dehydrogenase family protein [Alphaproteobacteria bacterium]
MSLEDAAPGTVHPATGAALEPVPATPAEQVGDVVARARAVQAEWAARSLDARERAVLALARAVVEEREALAAIVSTETGRSLTDSLISEVATAISHARAAIRAGRRALATEKVPISALDYPGKRAVIEAVPRGVVGIIAPWNYPFTQVFRHMVPALLSGNGVVVKPSEYTPRTGAWLVARCQDIFPAGLVGVVQGAGDVGAALIEHVDAITFTGSVATGRKVSVRCAERLIPCTAELGSVDAAIVLADCDLERTVAGIANWSMTNAGQDCSSIERLFVEEAIADTFVKRLAAVLGRLKVNTGEGEADIGPLQSVRQRAIVEAHVADAVERGAAVVVGGERVGPGFGYKPTLLDHCTDDMRVCQEETFGPVLPVLRVKRGEDAIARVNAASSGLNGSVWTRDLRRGEDIARQLEVGVALVNNHSITGTLPEAPWSGVKDTGTGVAMSAWAYPAYTRRRVVFIDSGSKPDPWWFPKDAALREFSDHIATRDMGSLAVLLKLLGALNRRVAAVRALAKGD